MASQIIPLKACCISVGGTTGSCLLFCSMLLWPRKNVHFHSRRYPLVDWLSSLGRGGMVCRIWKAILDHRQNLSQQQLHQQPWEERGKESSDFLARQQTLITRPIFSPAVERRLERSSNSSVLILRSGVGFLSFLGPGKWAKKKTNHHPQSK